MLRILHTLAQRPGRTGSGIFLNSLIDQATGKNIQQAVIAGIPVDELLNFDQIEKHYQYPVRFNTPQLPFPVAGMSDVMPYPSTRYSTMNNAMLKAWTSAFEEKLLLAAKDFKPQAILAHHLWLLTGLTRKIFPAIPLITFSHGTALRQLELAPKLRDQAIEGCRNVDLVLALNSFQKEEINLKYGIPLERIIVTGCGYNSEIFYPAEHKKSHDVIKLVYCGKLSCAKGVYQLLHVFNDLSRKNENIELIMIGSGQGPETAKIREMADKSPGKVIFTGAVPQSKVGSIFRECDVFILPSFYEGLGLVVLEALACGLKVVTSDIPGLNSWLGDTVNCSGQIRYVDMPRLRNADQPLEEDLPKYEADLKLAISETLEEINSGISENCRKEIKNKSWEQLFNTIYGELCEFRNSRRNI